MINPFEKLFRECRETLFDQFKATLCGVPEDLKAVWDAETDGMWEGAVDAASREVVGMPAAEVAKSSRDTDPCPCFVKREGDTDA